MIRSAEEFISLRDSALKHEYDRSAFEEAPISVWHEVIDHYPNHSRWVAHNKTVPVEILERLANSDELTREFVAQKRKLTLNLFEQLASDSCVSVRIAIAANRKCPSGLLKRLLADTDAAVVRVATRNFQARLAKEAKRHMAQQ